jgi:hypothetical protein
MMTDGENDFLRIAALLITKHGHTGAIALTERLAQAALNPDDPVKYSIWVEVADAIDELVRAPEAGEKVN